ncbi:MAG: RNA polymerase sigma factor [Bacteroidetes bacterium]|nr:RNA polymerase sigma factor [Bacteroidota bacterium]MBU1717585.1 RNA polymerase sigma factor [Bacteroidota bacterium]
MTVPEFNKCVDLFADGMYRFVLKNIRDEDDARDVVQDCFEKFWNKYTEVEFAKAKSYLFSAAYHTMIDKIRKEKRMTNLDAQNFDLFHYEQQPGDLKKVLDDALETLPDIQRSVILLRDYEGYSYQEIGEITDLSETQVKVYIFRARKALKEYLVSIDYVI